MRPHRIAYQSDNLRHSQLLLFQRLYPLLVLSAFGFNHGFTIAFLKSAGVSIFINL